ncbi:unnamed protein product [Camellia sinensis]
MFVFGISHLEETFKDKVKEEQEVAKAIANYGFQDEQVVSGELLAYDSSGCVSKKVKGEPNTSYICAYISIDGVHYSYWHVKDIGDKWNQLPEEEKNKYIQMGKLQSERYAQLKTVVQQKPPKVKIQTRIELTSICKIIRRLDKAQQQAVTDMGFHGILSLRCTHIDHDLCHCLVQNFDPSTHSLNVHGLRMLLTVEDVHELMDYLPMVYL